MIQKLAVLAKRTFSQLQGTHPHNIGSGNATYICELAEFFVVKVPIPLKNAFLAFCGTTVDHGKVVFKLVVVNMENLLSFLLHGQMTGARLPNDGLIRLCYSWAGGIKARRAPWPALDGFKRSIQDQVSSIREEGAGIAITKHCVRVNQSNLDSLKDGNQLYDAVIDFYMQILVHARDGQPHLPIVYAFASATISPLLNADSRQILGPVPEVFTPEIYTEYPLLRLPVHTDGCHLSLVALDQNAVQIQFFVKAEMLNALHQLQIENKSLQHLPYGCAHQRRQRSEPPKLMLPEKYTENRELYRGFANQLSVLFELQSQVYSTDRVKILTVVSFSLTRHQTLIRYFLKAFAAVFAPVDVIATAGERIKKLRQIKMAASTYAAEFLALSTDLEWNEAALMFQFKYGLNSEVRNMLLGFPEQNHSSMGVKKINDVQYATPNQANAQIAESFCAKSRQRVETLLQSRAYNEASAESAYSQNLESN
ncbi:hypothetical protein MP228_002776 [Amoeboaphelidium protococcarum]|nr:hypothetical protein MP228_002776 [Amoeboaphelidium protococcarum]